MTRPGWTDIGTLLAAIALPLVLFVALQSAFAMKTLRQEVEADALNRARTVNSAIDAALTADQSALAVLSGSHFLATHEWPAAGERLSEVQATRPAWKNLVVSDLATGAILLETRPGSGAARSRYMLPVGLTPGRAVFGGVAGAAPDCPCVAIQTPVFERQSPRYLLTLYRGTDDFAAIAVGHTPPGGVTAVVDRDGLFVARSKAHRQRLGQPATRYVREAIRAGRSGLYSGVTYEGLKNYTAFETSPLTGWSSHVAVRARSLTDPSLGSLILTLGAGLASLMLAVIMALVLLRKDQARRQEEARGAQSQKLAAIGQLASGVAHDFNNLLMVIDASLRRIAGAADPALEKPLANALAASERGAKLIAQLMAFTRTEPLEIGPVDLGVLIGGLRGLIEQSVGRAIRVELDVAEDARHVIGAADQLELAILNLAVNARDAMPAGGVLSLRSRAAPGRPDSVDLTVTDTGEGMSRDVAARALEPFFTTKPLGKGTGLGLAQVFGIVAQAGGTVDIESAPGAGTTVRLRLRRLAG